MHIQILTFGKHIMISWITRCLTTQIAQSTIYIDTAQTLWQDLKDSIETHEYAISFLKGLNDDFNTTKAQILLMELLPIINKILTLLIQQERHIVCINTKVLLNTNDARVQHNVNDTTQQWK
ncbi:hypothetical protein Lal_00004189 [Lupinus albus]|nr:hypothetical protein Lal_00004189 [Lupinus albus]